MFINIKFIFHVMQNYFTIFVNGEALIYSNDMSLKDLLSYLNFDITNIIVEYNKKIITSENFNKVFLSMSDRIEVITIVGGG